MSFVTLDYESVFRSRKDKGTPGPAYSLKNWTYEEYLRGSKVTKTHGLVEAPFRVHGVGVKIDRAPAEWVSHNDLEYFQKEMFPEGNNHTVLCHNTMFDGALLHWIYGLKAAKYYDTQGMSRALWNQQPATLKSLAERCFPNDKSMRKGDELEVADGIWYLDAAQEELIAGYCIQDVELTFACFEKMWQMGFPPEELEVMDMTLKMFIDRPFVLDSERVQNYQRRLQRNKERWYRISGWPRSTLASNDKFVARLEKDHGIKIDKIPSPTDKNPNNMRYPLAKDDLEFLAIQDKHPELRALWKARMAATANSELSRCARVLDHGSVSWMNQSGNIAMPLNYYKAHTGRWGGTNKQNPQNLGRGSILRRGLKAPEGSVVVVRDLSNIEGRMSAWFCGQNDMLDIIASGQDIYNDMATSIYGYPVNRKDPKQATEGFVGKVACLGPDTPVFTKQGLKAIIDVSNKDMVWDGEAWVKHEGLLSQGIKDTVNLAGISLTSDHKILCGSQWKDAKSLVQSEDILCQALETGWESYSSHGKKTHLISDLWQTWKKKSQNLENRWKISNQKMPVYDLLNAGPNHRFTILTEKGPLVVHNCLGLGYGMGANKFHHTLASGAMGKRVNIGIEKATHVVQTYRRKNFNISQMWKTLQFVIQDMANEHIVPYMLGPVRVEYRRIVLPSGMALNYPGLRELDHPDAINEYEYWEGKFWKKIYGGLLLENCISGSAEILTPAGWIRLDHYEKGMEVWDGEEFVRGGDLLNKGKQKTMELNGVKLTPDHKVLVDGETWKEASQLQGSDLKKVRLPDCNKLRRFNREEKHQPNDTPLQNQQQMSDRKAIRETGLYEQVYDIANCGPRHRFVVRAPGHEPFIVHNCIQALARIVMSSAMVRFNRWLGDKGQIALTVHDEVVAIVKEEHAEEAFKQLDIELTRTPEWADQRLVLESDGGIDVCYSK